MWRVSKTTSSGFESIVRFLGGSGTDGGGASLAVDARLDNVFVLMDFSQTMDADPSARTATLSSGKSPPGVAVVSLDSSLTYRWAVLETTATNGAIAGKDIAVTPSGDLYVTGTFRGTVDFDPGSKQATKTSVGNNDLFLAKLSNFGAYLWNVTTGGSNSTVDVERIAVDTLGQPHLTGSFVGVGVDFNPGPGLVPLTSGVSSRHAFVSKFLVDGSLSWAKSFGGGSGHKSRPWAGSPSTPPAVSMSREIGLARAISIRRRRPIPWRRNRLRAAVPRPTSRTRGSIRREISNRASSLDRAAPNQGAGLVLDSKGSPVVLAVVSGTVDFDPGQLDTFTQGSQADAALVRFNPLIIGDKVWLDQNSDGLRSLNEPGLPAVRVELYNSLDNELLDWTTTDAAGGYTFATMRRGSGQYYVKMIKPTGSEFTLEKVGAGANSSIDSDVNPTDRPDPDDPSLDRQPGDVRRRHQGQHLHASQRHLRRAANDSISEFNGSVTLQATLSTAFATTTTVPIVLSGDAVKDTDYMIGASFASWPGRPRPRCGCRPSPTRFAKARRKRWWAWVNPAVRISSRPRR